ncbi:hypothetical protein ANN_07228 [Periplaneta americana]|uniref:Uncharacterized protein n=1 Tax=Periplaneta americana TaxID=6978 RepID=A0ABQ8TFN2_PERAM|nr:hypothetical protein ANN_07228 [Periplaneta americana]
MNVALKRQAADVTHSIPNILDVQFKVCHGSLYAVMWLVDEPREFNIPTLPQRCITYEAEKLPSKYGVHSEESMDRSGRANSLASQITGHDPLDFYLWGLLKSLVYASAAPNVGVLQQRIEHACGIVRDEMNGLCDVQRSLRRRAQLLLFPSFV